MRLLFVTHILPFPPTDGGRIATFNAIKHLARSHEVFVASLAAPGEERHVEELRRYCSSVQVVYADPWRRFTRSLRAVAGAIPGTASLYYDPRLARSIRGLIAQHAIDLVVLEHLNTAAYRAVAGDTPAVLREHNVESRIWQRQAKCATSALSRGAFTAMAWRLRRYEAAAAAACSCCIAISGADAALLREMSPRARIATVPAGIDCEYFSPAPARDEPEPFSMVMVGSFAWKPKQHNLEALATRIFPRIRALVPAATLTVVGKGMPPELRRLLESHGIRVTGEVPDVRPFVRRSALVLNYVEVGGGIPLKVLEAMAMRKPVLSSAAGCEGLDIVCGRDLCVAGTAEEFTASASRLLRDVGESAHLAEAGYRCAADKYSCSTVTALYEQVYREVLAERRSPALSLARQTA